MRREFHNLKQRQMSVIEYQKEFTRLNKYSPEMLVTEEEKCHKFEDGLNDYIRAHVIGFGYEDFSKIVTCALNVERVKKEEYDRKERRQCKKNPAQPSSHQHQNKKFRGPHGSNQPTAQGPALITDSKTIIPAPSVTSAQGGSSRRPAPPYCTHCGRKHKGECWRLIGGCLVCGSSEHKVKIVLEPVLSQHPRLGVHFSSTKEQQGQQEYCIIECTETSDTYRRQTRCPCFS